MKKLVSTTLLLMAMMGLSSMVRAQEIDDEKGKTYYDDEDSGRKVREVFHYVLVYKFTTDANDHSRVKDTTITVRNGPYARYFRTGELECTGVYNYEKKDGLWKYYDRAGKLVKTETYKDDALIK
jgi:hypothetical protein